MKKYFKGISITLIWAMLFTLLPVQASVAGRAEPPIDSVPVNQTQKAEGKIIGEITEKREQNIKHFLKDDFTYEADIYPVPVHYLEDGKWKEIDNSLIDKKDDRTRP